MKNPRLLAGLACLFLASAAQALSIAIFLLPVRMAGAEGAYVGKVVSITDKAVDAARFKGDTSQMQIATVKVAETVFGKAAREIKVAFIVPPAVAPGGPRIIGGGYNPRLDKDQEGLLILGKHPTMKGVFMLGGYPPIVAKAAPNYATELKAAKDAARRMADPMKGLKSKDAGESASTAGLLVYRYKTSPGTGAKTEAVPAAESKLILEALAGGDWEPRRGANDKITPEMAFYRLGLTAADGWTPPMDRAGIADAAKTWLKDNAGKYKMTRFVREAVVSEEP